MREQASAESSTWLWRSWPRALHFALATHHPDTELADALAAAAAGAAARGARRDAVVLAEHALRLTPAHGERTERLLALGTYLVAAGEPQRVTDLLSPELDTLPPGPPRAQALVLLTDGVVGSNDEIRRYLGDALSESRSDPALRARVLAEIAVNDAVIRVERIRDAEASALEALAAAPLAGPHLEWASLYALGWARALRGRPLDDVCERFRGASGDVASSVTESPERVAGQRLAWRGEVEQARAVLTRLLALADERGESYSYVLQRLHVCQLELRCGNWDAAARFLDEWAESSERVMWSMYDRCRALLAARRGLPSRSIRGGSRPRRGVARSSGSPAGATTRRRRPSSSRRQKRTARSVFVSTERGRCSASDGRSAACGSGPRHATRSSWRRPRSASWARPAGPNRRVRRLGRVGGRRRQAGGGLTPAERRVVELAAEGLANKEIAQSLFVTVRTVEVHLKHAYAKLGVRSRTQLARRLSERA